MRQANVGILPVVEEGQVCGVITDRDLVVRALAFDADLRSTPVGECATGDPVVAHPDWGLDQAMETMARAQIGRLPVIPSYPLFRERYSAILWDKRWSWLNYFDFSLNNLLRFGFNDIRLRDEHMPGLVTALAWYQWSIGILYFALLLWTLSRTIPGLNLLIYFK